MSYFISNVTYNKMQENGVVKRVTERYLVDAVSVTEVEARTVEFVTPYISGEFAIPTVKRFRIVAADDCRGEYWWIAKIAFITINERTGAEKKTIQTYLVSADNFADACGRVNDGMKGTVADYEILSVSRSNITDYIPFKQ